MISEWANSQVPIILLTMWSSPSRTTSRLQGADLFFWRAAMSRWEDLWRGPGTMPDTLMYLLHCFFILVCNYLLARETFKPWAFFQTLCGARFGQLSPLGTLDLKENQENGPDSVGYIWSFLMVGMIRTLSEHVGWLTYVSRWQDSEKFCFQTSSLRARWKQ